MSAPDMNYVMRRAADMAAEHETDRVWRWVSARRNFFTQMAAWKAAHAPRPFFTTERVVPAVLFATSFGIASLSVLSALGGEPAAALFFAVFAAVPFCGALACLRLVRAERRFEAADAAMLPLSRSLVSRSEPAGGPGVSSARPVRSLPARPVSVHAHHAEAP